MDNKFVKIERERERKGGEMMESKKKKRGVG
jgi:hypothetical protein